MRWREIIQAHCPSLTIQLIVTTNIRVADLQFHLTSYVSKDVSNALWKPADLEVYSLPEQVATDRRRVMAVVSNVVNWKIR